MENVNEVGPLKGPIWTSRGTREALAESLSGVGVIRNTGWYQTQAGMALISDPRCEGGVETLHASLWESDPRSTLLDAVVMANRTALIADRFIAAWPELVKLSRVMSQRKRSASANAEGAIEVGESESLPETPPKSARVCEDPLDGGHMHIGCFQLEFVELLPEEAAQAKAAGEKPDGGGEVIFLDDGVLIIHHA